MQVRSIIVSRGSNPLGKQDLISTLVYYWIWTAQVQCEKGKIVYDTSMDTLDIDHKKGGYKSNFYQINEVNVNKGDKNLKYS